MTPCQSYIPGRLCRDGFPTGYPASSACTGRTCMSCGRPNDIVPACQREDLDARWLDDAGRPRYANINGGNHAEQ